MPVAIAGFGSLLSESSARRTFPNLFDFKLCRIAGYRRVFAHCAAVFFERGIARAETGEISSLSVEPCDGAADLVCTLFSIPDDELPAFYEREMEFRISEVTPLTLDTREPMLGVKALVCEKSSDARFMEVVCKNDPAKFHEIYGKWGVKQVWDRVDVLPCRVYLRHCVLAARKHGPVCSDNFLDETYLCDRKTTVRQHLASDPTIMEEGPPEAAKHIYAG
ncbi:hypothetical protein DIPPA_06940 [Diplonema papillatum]|nr:hypothetical protein DIPPA_06940 [Diplonema papillatum]|eukprot:gene12464-19282_t